MRRASRIDDSQTAIVNALRKAGILVQSLAAVGQGVPDLLCLNGSTGRLVLLECKSPDQPKSARKLRQSQVEWHQQWIKAPIFVVETAEEALEAVGAMKTPMRDEMPCNPAA